MMIESPTSIERARKRPFFAKAQIRPLEGNSYRGFVESSHPAAALWLQPPPSPPTTKHGTFPA